MATTNEKKSVENAPKATKKVVAKKAPVEAVNKTKATSNVEAVKETATKVTSTVSDAAKSGVESVKETTTKVTSTVSDATKSSVESVKEVATSAKDSVKDTYTDIETAIKNSKEAGNSRAKKILSAIIDDKANTTVVNFVGHIGGATSVCATIMCSPMKLSADKAETFYKKLTA